MPDVAEMIERYAAAVERSVPPASWPTVLPIGDAARPPRHRRTLVAVAAAFVVLAGAIAVVVTSRDEDRGIRTDPEPAVTTTTVPLHPVIVPRALPADQAPTWREVQLPSDAPPGVVVATDDGFVAMAGGVDSGEAWHSQDGTGWERIPANLPANSWLAGYRNGLYYTVVGNGVAGEAPTLLVGPALDRLDAVSLGFTQIPSGGHLEHGRFIQSVATSAHGVIVLTQEQINLDMRAIIPPEILAVARQTSFGPDEVSAVDADFDVLWSARLDEVLTPDELALHRAGPPDVLRLWASTDGRSFVELDPPVQLSQRAGIGAFPDAFVVFDRTASDPDGYTRDLWLLRNGAIWERITTTPGPPIAQGAVFSSDVPTDHWVPAPIAGHGERGVALSAIDVALGRPAPENACPDFGGRCPRQAISARLGTGRFVAATSTTKMDRWEIYWSPDDIQWTSSSLGEITGLGDGWSVAQLAADDTHAAMVVTDQSFGPMRTRLFVSSVE